MRAPQGVPSPLPYHWETVRHLKEEEPGLWQWFASGKARADQADAARLDLLKTTYRIERETQPQLYDTAGEVMEQFGSKAPITFYQAQTGQGMNAGLLYLPGEAHLVLTGPVLAVLSATELRAVLGHELAHFLLLDGWEGEFRIAADLLHALCHDPAAQAAAVHLESARLFTLYTEVFADRGAFLATGDVLASVSALVKLQTGLSEVSPESYLRQAEEIFSKSRAQTSELTHPEAYIRARALKLWAEEDQGGLPTVPDGKGSSTRENTALAEITRMIEGPPTLDRLDLLAQKKVAGTTRLLIQTLLSPRWFRTEAALGHARLFFDDFAPADDADSARLATEVQNSDSGLQDYFCYVLLDFSVADRELADTSLAAALVLSKRLGLNERFAAIAQKELGLGKKQFNRLDGEAERLVAAANETASNS